jgi:ABC-type sugar transport system ATPase subunit
MRDGQCVAELQGAEISQNAIIHAMAEGSAVEDGASQIQQ